MSEKMNHILNRLRDRRGVTAVVIAIVITVLIGFIALAVDIGYVAVTKNELQNVADSAALAATRKLGAIYEPMNYPEQQAYVCSSEAITSVAQEVAQKNTAAGMNLTIRPEDVKIGVWDRKTKLLTETIFRPDAVTVTARRDTSANGPINTFFARVFSKNDVNVAAKATAALGGLNKVGPKGLPIPVGISKKWFDKPNFCDQIVKFQPTGDLVGCAGWHTFKSSSHSDSEIRAILKGLKDGTYISPETEAGKDFFNFTGGTQGEQAFLAMVELYDAMKGKNDGILDRDENPNTWTTTVVVYDRADCSNPQQELLIVGFATVEINEVTKPPAEKRISAKVLCDDIEKGRGNGSPYGTKGSIPGLVQ